jgi:hypothetical protein
MIGIRTQFNLQFLRERYLADNLQTHSSPICGRMCNWHSLRSLLTPE